MGALCHEHPHCRALVSNLLVELVQEALPQVRESHRDALARFWAQFNMKSDSQQDQSRISTPAFNRLTQLAFGTPKTTANMRSGILYSVKG